MDTFARTASVVGVLTLGFEDEIEAGVQVLRDLVREGVPVERATEIIEASRTVKPSELTLEPHAIEEMREEPLGEISLSQVNDTINQGTHFWDVQERSLVAFENNVYPGEVRVAVLIDFDRNVVGTVYREKADDEALAAILFDGGRQRFIKLPPRP